MESAYSTAAQTTIASKITSSHLASANRRSASVENSKCFPCWKAGHPRGARPSFSTTATRVSGSFPLCRRLLTVRGLPPAPSAWAAGVRETLQKYSGPSAWQAQCCRTHGRFLLSARERGVPSGRSGVGDNVPRCSKCACERSRKEHSPEPADGWPDSVGRRFEAGVCGQSRCFRERLGPGRRP